MSRQAWIAALVAALLTTTASAGLYETRYWPTTFVPQELVTIPVVMDVGLWIDVAVQDKTLKLEQVAARRFEGSVDVEVRSNFHARLLYSIAPTGVVNGQYSVSPAHVDVDVPGGTTTVRAQLANPDLTTVLGGRQNVSVAYITVMVMPKP